MNAEKKALQKLIASEVHQRAIKKFPRRKVVTKYKNETWAIDLVDMQQFADENKNNKYMFNCIDIYSRYAWVRPLKTKSAVEVLKVFKSIIEESGFTPEKIWVDEGGEFYNKQMEAFCKSKKIVMYSTHGEHKSVMIERFNRTLKEKMWRKFTEDETNNWIEFIDEMVEEYNNTKHRSINMTPNKAMKRDISKTEEEVIQEREEEAKIVKPKFKIGDRVRISRIKQTFEKGYTNRWSYEIYTIKSIHYSKPVTYVLEDADKEEIIGKFYESEIRKTKQDDVYLIEKVLNQKTVKGRKMYLVKWVGYPNKFNSWVDEKDFKI